MPDAGGAAVFGYVCLGLVSLIGAACGVKQLLGRGPAAKASARPADPGAVCDVTRREFEEVKAYAKESVHDVRGSLQSILQKLAVIEYQLGARPGAKRAEA